MLFAYDLRDCHGPSGLAMTLVSLLFRGLVALRLRSGHALWLRTNLKKQSQFRDDYNDFPCAGGRVSLEYAKIYVNNLNLPE
jgi:hypothetical protein